MMNNVRLSGCLACLLLPATVFADQCPSAEQVRERNISRDYEWSVAETVTLPMLLEVSELREVSLQNHGEFVSCHYLSDQLPVRMDGAAPDPGCLVTRASGTWISLPGGTLKCNEEKHDQCHFSIQCYDTQSRD
jgi:hypothetical protein